MTAPDWLTSAPIAHRGLHEAGSRPENSLAAFTRAVSESVPFEFDVQLSRDGVPVVLHDADIARMTGGAGLVRDLDWAQLRTLRVGESGEPVPRLDEVLDTVDGEVPMVVDVRRWGFSRSATLERAVADRLRSYAGAAVVQSFDPVAVARLRRLLPDRAVGQASGSLPSAGRLKTVLGRMMLTNAVVRPDFLTYELAALPDPFVTFWRGPRRPVLAYTAHSPADAARAVRFADGYFFAGFTPEARF
ncbi:MULTISPECIES: glycerophosphodiester phosphodiesterase family protein [Prauserella salsuginis group]|uniref:Glycerophosphodiester phosphodiesterase family protein n=1 Tax=Prauserella salsuginis TaxID=387889 RepID=A0ABW6FXN4_9PSEU|nr:MULTISPECIES: glycerophosphodiester phosphodiesterase family protein [Prauserella salsuginis group]MCR3720308.1 Glycerophosphoryl diester phosphodiesterase [Prauserella flava]MCR3733983.1 Glycerophosphoryl diester phosphodiesterase [Prauserella salsuginis]